eukprot:gene3506-4006_t
MATLGGYPLRRLIRNCSLSALAAAVTGLSYKQLKKKPGKISKIFAYSFAAGGTGLLLGGSYGWYRKNPGMFRSGLSGGVNFFLLTGCYLGIRESILINGGLKFETDTNKVFVYQTSAVSGAITGFVAGVFWWSSLAPILSNTVIFCTVAAAGQFGIDKLKVWKQNKAIQRHYPELIKLEWSVMNEEEKEKVRKKEQGLIPWIFELIQERPYSGKLTLKLRALEEEFLALSEEENELKTELNIPITEDTKDVDTNVELLKPR